jgi:hypothetical protein
MTAKEKAKELVNQFYFSLPNNGSFEGINSIPKRWEEAVRCALIAVNEILENFGLKVDGKDHYCGKYTIEFYQEVKQEIEKLWNEETK